MHGYVSGRLDSRIAIRSTMFEETIKGKAGELWSSFYVPGYKSVYIQFFYGMSTALMRACTPYERYVDSFPRNPCWSKKNVA